MNTHFEQQEQIAVANYLKVLGKLFTINAYSGTNRKTGGKLKAAGYAIGCPDIMVFEEGKGPEAYRGLFIELKRSVVYGTSKVSDEQRCWLAELNKRGYMAVVCIGAQEAYKVIDEYFGIK